MKTHLLNLARLSACLLALAAPADALTVTRNLDTRNAPWTFVAGGLNAGFAFRNDEAQTPLSFSAGNGFDFTPGRTLVVRYVSGVGAEGSPDAAGVPGWETSNIYPARFPSSFVDVADHPSFLCAVIGVFTDAAGAIIGKPFVVGNLRGLTIPDGAARLQLGINDDIFGDNGGVLTVSVSQGDVSADELTEPPTLTQPAAATPASATVAVAFTLPEAALPGSVKLSFWPGAGSRKEFTLGATHESAGAHSFTFDPAAPTSGSDIVSGSALTGGVYAVSLSYQDNLGNPVARSTAIEGVHVNAQNDFRMLVSGDGPWRAVSDGLNSNFTYGIGIAGASETSPRFVDVRAGFDFTPGRQLTIRNVSSATQPGRKPYGLDGDGTDSDAAANDRAFPSYYLAGGEFPVFVGAIIGVFADNDGTIIGAPFKIGNGRTATIPAGATRLQMGVNERPPINHGISWTVSVSQPADGSDATTDAPLLSAPTSNAAFGRTMQATFTLPEAALPGSVKLNFYFPKRSLTLSAAHETAGAHTISFDPANPLASAHIASGGAVPDTIYRYVTLSYEDAAGNPATASAAAQNVKIDTGAPMPTLSAPWANTFYSERMAVAFRLPEAAAAGSVKLIFDNGGTAHVLTLASAMETLGAHSFVFDPANPTLSAAVAAGAPLPEGACAVRVAYQDALGNAASSAAIANVTIDYHDIATRPPELTAPVAGATVGNPVAISYFLPEEAQTNSLVLTFDDGAVVRSYGIGGADFETPGPHSFVFDPTNPAISRAISSGPGLPDGTYTVVLSYRDLASHSAAQAIATEVVVDTLSIANRTRTFFVDGRSGPWLFSPTGLNKDFHYGLGQEFPNALAPTVVNAVNGIDIAPGRSVHLEVVARSANAPNANSGFATDGVLFGTLKRFPSASFNPGDYPIYVHALIGVFTDTHGAIVGEPFKLGNMVGANRTLVVPAGARQLQLGINDDRFLSFLNDWNFTVAVTGIGSPAVPFANEPAESTSLVGHFTFDTPANFGADSSGCGNHATRVENLLTTSGVAGGAASFRGIFRGMNFEGAANPIVNVLAGNYSFSVWVRTVKSQGRETDAGFSGAGIVYADRGGSANDCAPIIVSGSKIGHWTGGSYDGQTSHSTSDITTGEWTHVAVTRDFATGRKTIYINGVLESEMSHVPGLSLNASNRIGVGDWIYGGDFQGDLDDLQVYSAVLNASQVAYLAAHSGWTIDSYDSSTPLARNDGPFSLDAGVTATLDVLANDSAPVGGVLTITQAVASPGATVAIINGGTALSFTSAVGASGYDYVNYQISDGLGGVANARALVAIGAGTISFPRGFATEVPTDAVGQPRRLTFTVLRDAGFRGAVTAEVAASAPTTTPSGFAPYAYGTQYQFVNESAPGRVEVAFAEGASSATFEVQLNTTAAAAKGVFVLDLVAPTGDATLGAPNRTTVTILAPPGRDSTAPTLTLDPVPGTTNDPSLTLSGTAVDGGRVASGVLQVTYTLKNIAGTTDPIGITLDDTSFSAELTLQHGVNSIAVTAMDYSGKTTTKKISVRLNNPDITELSGTYAGLVVPAGTPSIDQSGIILITVGNSTSVSGKITVGGSTVPFSGALDNNGNLHFKPDLDVLFEVTDDSDFDSYLGSLTVHISEDLATGNLLDGTTPLATFSARRLATSAPPALLNLAGKGAYTFHIPSSAPPGFSEADFPTGDGIGAISVSANGNVGLAGFLADGTALSTSGRLAIDGSVVLFDPLYRKGGGFATRLVFDTDGGAHADTDVLGEDSLWIRPALPRAQYYKGGWPTGATLDLLGAKYDRARSPNVLPGVTTDDLDDDGNVIVTFSGGKLSNSALSATANIGIARPNTITVVPFSKDFTLSLSFASGLFGGKFLHTDGTMPAYKGVVLQKGGGAGGFGFFRSTPPKANYREGGEVGKVTLEAAP